MTRFIVISLIALLWFSAANMAQATTGLPIPRFVSLKSDEVNVRTGPGKRYPINWVYLREGYPVEIINEFEHWRKIRDRDDRKGWIHKSLLTGLRTAIVSTRDPLVFRNDPEPDATPVFRTEPGVIVRLIECTREWCEAQTGGMKGWAPKSGLWGVRSDEAFEE